MPMWERLSHSYFGKMLPHLLLRIARPVFFQHNPLTVPALFLPIGEIRVYVLVRLPRPLRDHPVQQLVHPEALALVELARVEEVVPQPEAVDHAPTAVVGAGGEAGHQDVVPVVREMI